MELSRRDAILALIAGGGAGFGTSLVSSGDTPITDDDDHDPLTDSDIQTLISVGEVVYPSEISSIDEFISEYVTRLWTFRQQEIKQTVTELDAYTRRQYGASFDRLSPTVRDSILRSIGVDRTGSDPDGSLPERIRFYIVNQLLFALYTTPTGSKLVDIENPIGYAADYETYQRPPPGKQRPPKTHEELRNNE